MANEYKKISDFLSENGKYNDSETTFSVKQSDYEKLAASQGVTKDMLNAVAQLNQDVWNGMLTTATDKLSDKIKAAKKSGDDPKDERVTVGVMTKQGNMKLTQYAYKKHNNPQAKDDTKTLSFGSARLKLECKSKIDRDHLKALQGRIESSLK